MKRIVIIEGSVRGIAAESPSQDVLTIDINDVDTDTIAVPSAIGEVIAREAYRKSVRVVVEIGAEEIGVGPLASATREELIHALAAARHAADEYRRENEVLVKSNEGLQSDFDAMAAKNDDLLCELAASRRTADDYANCANELTVQIRTRDSIVAFDPEKHITKETVCEWLEEDASSSDQASSAQRKLKNPTAAQLLAASADDTRAIIDRINTTKETP